MSADVMMRALYEAIGLGHAAAGVPHVLLALLDPAHASIAQEVLHAAGVTRESIEESAHRAFGAQPPDPEGRRYASTEPLWHETLGRAEGMATAFGHPVLTPEHILLGMLWQPRNSWLQHVLALVGSGREAVVAELVRRGVTIPPLPLPVLGPPMTQAAVFPAAHVEAVNRVLRAGAPDSAWGIGVDPTDEGFMVVVAAAHVALAASLNEAVGAGAWWWRDNPEL